jgi:alkylation response protein AidB-like acyl-CoA dehydrogenase
MNETAEIKEKKMTDTEQLFVSSPLTVDRLEGRGGSFLVIPIGKADVFSREQFSEDHKMFESAAQDFALNRILPVHKELSELNKDLSCEIFKEMGELGFLGVDAPEEFGGLGLDKTTACIVADCLSEGRSASIMVTMSAHTGIASLPIIWYGNKEQKEKYLTKMASGEYMACYSLTEPGAGSDALSGTTTAKLNDEGTHYLLNGQKIFVTNGAWADVCVTFANVDGKYTAFILDKDCDGWVVGAEEKKMGIKGSSTTTFFFEDCKVPVANVLGEVGQGGPIAFNVLYVGRYKLGVTTAAGSKYTMNGALDYAIEREQFSRSIAEFGMVQNKLAKMVVKSWEADTVNYMTSGSIDKQLEGFDKNDNDYFKNVQKAVEDHGIEASVCKVIGSEALAYNVDEGVQILGGAGFIEEYEMAGMYRDERINRIFEGTNEINRMIVGGYTLKKAILEDIPLRDLIIDREVDWIPETNISDDEPLKKESEVVEFSRSTLAYTLNELILKYGQDFKNEQWLLEPFADVVISLCILDTGFKRYNQLDEGIHKNEVREVLLYSIAEQYESLLKNVTDILSFLDLVDESSVRMDKLNKWVNELNYSTNKIALKKSIVNTLFKHKKYYLD